MATKRIYVYRQGQVRKLKEGVDWETYHTKYPEAIKICAPPSDATMERWYNDEGACKALDGCHVEPDGTCPHGLPSWMMAQGFI